MASLMPSNDAGVRAFLHRHGASTSGPDPIMREDLMKSLIAVALMAFSSAPYSFFIQACEMSINESYEVSSNSGYNWIQARTKDPRWNDGCLMNQEDVDKLLSQKHPI